MPQLRSRDEVAGADTAWLKARHHFVIGPYGNPFLVLKEGGHLVAATQPVSQEETARHRVSGAMMRLVPSADGLGRIARLLEEGTIRPDVATVYALQDAAQAWKDIAGNLSPSGPGAARRRSHGKIVLLVA